VSVFAPLLFKSSDPGAPTLSGTAGDLLNVLSASLIINKAFAAVSGASFLDRTAEARTQGGTPFTMFQTPGTSDEFYIGMSVKFGRAKFTLATLGVGGTYVWEYWNGTAWTTLTVTDGTSGFTASGIVTWTAPASWVSTAVNGATLLWVRVRLTVANGTNPTVDTLTVTGWSIAFGPTTNQADYQQGGGNLMYVDVNDNAPGVGTGKEARVRGFETMSALATGTGPFPTVAQFANGLFIRKSATADATTRAWIVLADDRSVYMFVLTTDVAGAYYGWHFGDFFSLVANDSFRTILIARTTENTNSGAVEALPLVVQTALNVVVLGHYVPRVYTGLGSAVQVGKHTDAAKNNNSAAVGGGALQFLNGADGGLYIGPCWVHEATVTLRGRLRGFYSGFHAVANFTDGDIFAGAGVYAGRSFLILKTEVSASKYYVVETSDTWESN
jgi:hypothetical protein